MNDVGKFILINLLVFISTVLLTDKILKSREDIKLIDSQQTCLHQNQQYVVINTDKKMVCSVENGEAKLIQIVNNPENISSSESPLNISGESK